MKKISLPSLIGRIRHHQRTLEATRSMLDVDLAALREELNSIIQTEFRRQFPDPEFTVDNMGEFQLACGSQTKSWEYGPLLLTFCYSRVEVWPYRQSWQKIKPESWPLVSEKADVPVSAKKVREFLRTINQKIGAEVVWLSPLHSGRRRLRAG